MEKKQLSQRILSWFLQGMLYLAPVSLTVYIIFISFRFVDSILTDIIKDIVGFRIPGLGILVMLVGITIIGFLGSSLFFGKYLKFFDKMISQAPLVKVIYTSIKSFISAFVGKDRRFTEPVLVKVNRQSDIEKLGFITQKDITNLGIPRNKVAVYLPHSYNFSGNLFIVPVENVTHINAPSAEVMKFIVTAGVTSIDLKAAAADIVIKGENNK